MLLCYGMASELLISIDLGAQNTGVMFAESVAVEAADGTVAAGVTNSTGVLLRLAPGQQWSQVPRRAARHLSRNSRRRKLAKRLLREILLAKNAAAIPPPAAKFINGLCNRRGFTYHAEELDELAEHAGFNEREGTILHELAKEFFPAGRTILESLQRSFADVEKVLNSPLFKDSLYLNSKIKEGHALRLQAEEFLKNCDGKPLQKKLYTEARKILESSDRKKKGHLPRADYLRNIHTDIVAEDKRNGDFAAVLQSAGFSADRFADIVGHVSNLPWRVLHNYFNDTNRTDTANAWNNERLLKLINKEVQGWRCDKNDKEAQENRDAYLKALTAAAVLSAWARIKPEKTVPPFENRGNHHPPKCMSLLIATERLNEDALRRVTAAFLAADENLNEQLKTGKKSCLARLLQRVLDCSIVHDKVGLRGLANGYASESQKKKLAKFLAAGGAQIGDMAVFLEFAKQYYDESAQGAHGTWSAGGGSVLRRCGINPPHKAKIKDALIARVLGCDRQEVSDIEDFLRNNKAGKKGLWAICKEAATLQKKHGSVMMKPLRDAAADGKNDKDAKEVQKNYEHAEKAAQVIAEHLEHDEAQWRRYANPFSMAQLFRHIDGTAGFSSTCRDCSEDNAWRMQMSAAADGTMAARAKALPSDSVRPFDGMLLRILTAQAEAIARLQMDKLAQDGEAPRQVTICIEQNAFSFSMGLDGIKGVKNAKRQKNAKEGLIVAEKAATDKAARLRAQNLCPYTGETITHRNLDHIIPRAACRRWGGAAAFNSEANLIACSAAGNTQKAERLYELRDLHLDYLRAVFPNEDRNEISRRIEDGVRPLLDNPRKYTSFADLVKHDEESARCLRHALFVSGLREEVTAKILNTERKARVNGTQRFLAKHIWQALDRQFARRNWQRPLRRLFRVDAEEVHEMRLVWLGTEWEKPENAAQGAASHVADAAVVCALARNVESWADEFMPKSVHIEHLEKRKPWRRERPGHYKVFGDKIYGERFLPLLVNAAGECRIGFADDNSVLIKKPERWLQALRPFLYVGKSPLADTSILQLQERARASQAVRLHVHKRKAMQALLEEWQAVQNGGARVADVAEFLRILHYTTLRQDIKEAVDEAIKGKFKLLDAMVQKKNIVNIEDKTLENGKVCLPIHKKWQQLHDIVAPLRAQPPEDSQSADVVEDIWQKIKNDLFPQRQPSGKLHHRRHLARSLPHLVTPSGTWRIRRKTADGGNVFQLLSVDEFGARGFAEEESGAVDFKHAAPLAELLKSHWLAPAENLPPPPDKVVDFDEWEEVDKPAASTVRRLWLAPHSKDRMCVRVEIQVADLLKIAQTANGAWDHWRKIPAEIKTKDKTKDISKTVLDVLALGGIKPRDKILVRHIGEAVANIEFVIESSKPQKWFNAKRIKNGG